MLETTLSHHSSNFDSCNFANDVDIWHIYSFQKSKNLWQPNDKKNLKTTNETDDILESGPFINDVTQVGGGGV